MFKYSGNDASSDMLQRKKMPCDGGGTIVHFVLLFSSFLIFNQA